MTTVMSWKGPSSQVLWGKDAECSPGARGQGDVAGEGRRKRIEAPQRWQSIQYIPKQRENKKGVNHKDRKMHLRRCECLLIE